MFERSDLLAFLSDLDQAGEQAWIGDCAPDDAGWCVVDLFKRPGFRATPGETGRFDRVLILQDTVGEQGWRLLIDAGIRMLRDDGILAVRYLQNQYITLPALKNFVFRKYGIKASVHEEAIKGGEFITAFRIERQSFARPASTLWTFGILTQGKKAGLVERLCRTVRAYGGDAHEILIVGPPDPSYEPYAPRYIDKEYSKKTSDICVKKNDLVNRAEHENLCIVHDRYWLNEDFFSGFDEFGYDFDFLTVRQHHESGKNYPSYCAIDDRSNLIWGRIYECGNENQTWVRNYLNGGLIIAKRALLRTIPFNSLIFHNQAEDVELARQMAAWSVLPRINRLSSAVTDVADHLTDAFTFAPATDYDAVFFPPLPAPPPSPAQPEPELPPPSPAAMPAPVRIEPPAATSPPLATSLPGMADPRVAAVAVPPASVPAANGTEAVGPDVNPRPWGRFSGVVHRIERRRRMGASWKGVAAVSVQFAYFRMLRTVRRPPALPDALPPEAPPPPVAAPADEAVPAGRTYREADGVNVMLYAADPGGVLNVTSYYIRSLLRKGVPLCIIDIQLGVAGSLLPPDLTVHLRETPLYPTNTWCIGFPLLAHHVFIFERWCKGRLNLNFTHWELPYIPRRLWGNFDAADGFIVDSEFVRDAIRDATDKPITLVDPEVRIPPSQADRYGRSHFGLPDDRTLFLINWEFTSSTIRKNPEAAIAAFFEAFADLRHEVALVMHVKFEHRHGDERRAEYEAFLADTRRTHPGIIILEQNSFSYEEALGLKGACDCYVSLHRAEGYGMGCAEALALGRRCVMTGWSGNMELMKNPRWRRMAYPVAVALVPVTPADYPWVEAEDEVMQLWADPRHGDAVRQLRRAYEAIVSARSMAA